MAFIDIFKVLFLPLLIAGGIYALVVYIILPLYRNHRTRYSQYLPLDTLSQHTSGLRTRIQASITRSFMPSYMHWRYDVRTGRRISSGDGSDEEFLFGAEEGESMVGFDFEQRRREGRLPVRGVDGRVEGEVEIDSERRLSRELEEGFKDESEDEDGRLDDRRR